MLKKLFLLSHKMNHMYTCDSSAPLKHAWHTSWKATARGTTSLAPMVRGLGPLDMPTTPDPDPMEDWRP